MTHPVHDSQTVKMTPGRRLLILILLIIAAILSYVDRGNLSVVKPEISAAFEIGASEMGWLFSAFFWSYSICQIGAGWVTDRYDVKWVFAIGFLIWTLATLATGLVGGFAVLLCMRLLLGIGESVVYPAVSRILLENFEEDRRGLANALIAAGTKIGPAISILLGGLIVARWGWRLLFIATGLVSLAWLVPWVMFVPSQRKSSAQDRHREADRMKSVTFTELVGRTQFWGTTIGFFCLGYSLYFLISWLPAYLEEERHFSKEQMAILGSLPFAVMAVVTILGGWFSDWWISRGASITASRMSMLVIGFSIAAASLFLTAFVKDDPVFMLPLKTLFVRTHTFINNYAPLGEISGDKFAPGGFTVLCLLSVACTGLGLFSSNAWAVTQTLAGSYAASKWSGLTNAIGNMGGVFSSILTGWIVEGTNSYGSAFIASSLVLVIGVLANLFLVRKIMPVDWHAQGGQEGELSAAV